jgi:hypothetical protein
MSGDKKVVTIFGTSKAVEGDGVFESAVELGRLLASQGYTIANGGYGGTMLAAAKGARQAGGEVIGVTCSAFGRGRANEYLTRQIATDSLQERLNTLLALGSAYFVLPGGTGTLLELAQVWELKNKCCSAADKPIIIVGDFWSDVIGLMKQVDPECVNCVAVADGPRQAVEMLISEAFGKD